MNARIDRWQALKDNPSPGVLIVGAGINGIGTFRDLALQGLDVVLIDRGDYCSGASAASSHMVHGGIRYLENGEFSLVREAVRERNQLIEYLPHLVDPLPTTFPIFKIFSGLLNAPLKFLGLLDKPSERGALVIKLGMVFYDAFTREQKTVPPHHFRNRSQSLAEFPDLNPEIRYTATYYDGCMSSPERIAMELILDALEANPQALPLNYVSLKSARGREVLLKDEISGEELTLTPKVLVNAAGPWIDFLNQRMGCKTPYVSGTKGSHLILDNPLLKNAIGDHEFFFENKDGRIVLIFPLLGKVLIGSTDLRIDHPDQAVITEEEVDYFFSMIGRVFPAVEVNRSQIIYSFSGVRPLQRTVGGTTGQISRDHIVQELQPGELLDIPVLSLVGGKWTSFRAFSEQAADKVLGLLGEERLKSTWNLPIGGSRGYPASPEERDLLLEKWSESAELEFSQVERLFERYGTKTARLTAGYPDRLVPLKTVPEITRGELEWILKDEDIQHLDDLILRRTTLAKVGLITEDSLREVAGICAAILGWDEGMLEGEIQRYQELMLARHRMDFTSYVPD
ncbi:MAG: glycerol-3-phosphate dehydrogenase/oxidase [Anaerolineales bacterium]